MVKTFFFNMYSLMFNFSFYLLISLLLVSVLTLFATLRKRFFFFMLVVILFSMWGFLLDLDGMMLVLLTAEFTIVLLFLMTYIQLYSNYNFIAGSSKVYYLLAFTPLAIWYYTPLHSVHFYTSYYTAINHVVASDFFILYYFLFDKLPILVILMTLIISFFSLFFIVVYFNLKLVKNAGRKASKDLYFLRKQTLTKQTSFNTRVYTFQN